MDVSLTQNGIIHLSAGFDGPYILQAFSIRKNPTNNNQLSMCLTDGQIYIGASFTPSKFLDFENFNVVKITAQYYDRMKPMQLFFRIRTIKTLQVLSKSSKKLIGNPPCTLTDYFNNEVNFISEPQPKKKIKMTVDEFAPILLSDSSYNKQNEVKTPKFNKQDLFNTKQPKLQKPKAQKINKRQKSKKRLKLASDSQSDQIDLPSSSADNFKATFIKQSVSPINTVTPFDMEGMDENSYIRDLFERHTGWILLCRVNYRSLARCQNGLYAVNFVITDSARDEIKCVYFIPSAEKAKQLLKVGKSYLFACGQVKESKEGQLQIIFDRNSQFLQKQNVNFPVNPKKITRVDRILEQSPQSEINVIGIIRKIKNKGEKLKTKNKYVATICDPITNYEIDFLLFLNEDEKPIEKGMIVVLHSYQIYRQNSICRLNSTYRSYYFEEKPLLNGDKNDLVNQLDKFIQQKQWDNENYKNISMFAFTQRPINQLKSIHKKTDDDRIYSSVDCWIMQVSRKKSYYACKTCKKPTEKKQMGLFQCSNCKKMVEVILTFTLSVTFTDSTGSCMIDVIGEHAQNLIERKSLEFYTLPNDEQNSHLQGLRYKNVQLRLKTQKKSDNKLAHSVWGIQRSSPQVTLKEIQKLLNQKNLKFDDKW